MGNKIMNLIAVDEITPLIDQLTDAEKSDLGKVPLDLLVLRLRNLVTCKNSFTPDTSELVFTFGVLGTKEAFLAAALGTSDSF